MSTTTENLYVGNGSTVLYSFIFPYINEDDIYITLDGLQTTEYTLANATTVEFNTAPATGVAIRIFRVTDIEEVTATFFPGSAIRAQDLNDNFEQTLYVAQENQGNTFRPDGALPMVGNLDLGGFDIINGGGQFNKTVDLDNNRVTNVADPINSTDAANRAYVDNRTGGNTEIVSTAYVYYTATQGDTVLTSNVGGVPVFAVSEGLEQIYVNGALQQTNVDYVTDSSSQITFTQPLLQDDVVAIHCINNVPNGDLTAPYTYPGGVQQTVQARLEQYVSVKDFGAAGDGVTDDTAAVQAAVQASQHVILPAGTYKVSSSITLNAASNGLVLEGSSASIVPSTNRVQIFQIVGADSVTFKGITFDNSANGILQNEAKSSVLDPASYAGNGLNAVVYAAKSTDVAIQGCKFIEFNSGLIYIHDWEDNQTLGGTVSIEDCIYDGCSFGNLINNPSYLFLNNILNINNVDSLNSDAVTDPGHLLYVTDRSGAIPLNITCSNIQDSNGENSVLKIRKGENASVSNVTVSGSGKGVEVWNVKTGSLSNCSITLAQSLSSNNSALEVADCGSVVVSNSSFDTRGIDAWAIRVRDDGTGSQTYSNNGMTVSDCNFVTSFTDVSQVGKAAITCEGQTNVTFRDLNFVHEGSIANTRPLIDFSDSSYSVVSSIKCRFVDASTLVDVVRFQADTNNCIFIYSPDALLPPAAEPYSDSGTNNVVTASYSASRLPAGSAASPTIAFDASPTTGFYRSGNNVMALSVSGTATYAFLSNRFQPASDNTIDLGTGALGWKNIYCDYVLSNKLRLSGLPTSTAGLQVGDVWNNSGTLKIV